MSLFINISIKSWPKVRITIRISFFIFHWAPTCRATTESGCWLNICLTWAVPFRNLNIYYFWKMELNICWKFYLTCIIGECLGNEKQNLQPLWNQNLVFERALGISVGECYGNKRCSIGRSSGELNSRSLKLRLELRWQLKSHVSTSGASISWLTYMNASIASASSTWRGSKSVFRCRGTEGLGLQFCQFDTSWQHRPPTLALCFLAFLSNISCFLKKEIT